MPAQKSITLSTCCSWSNCKLYDCQPLMRAVLSYMQRCSVCVTGVNAAGDAGDTSPPPNILVGGDVNGNIPPILLRTFGYSRPLLVALRSLSLKPISFGYKTPPIRFSQAGGQSAHKAHPPNLELALTPLVCVMYRSLVTIMCCGCLNSDCCEHHSEHIMCLLTFSIDVKSWRKNC